MPHCSPFRGSLHFLRPAGTLCSPKPHSTWLCLLPTSEFSFQEIKVRKMCFLFIQHLPFTVLAMPVFRSTLPSGLLSASFILYFLWCGSPGREVFQLLCVWEIFFLFSFIYSFFLRKSLFCLHLWKPFSLGVEPRITGSCSLPVSKDAVCLCSGARCFWGCSVTLLFVPLHVGTAPFFSVLFEDPEPFDGDAPWCSLWVSWTWKCPELLFLHALFLFSLLFLSKFLTNC